MIHTVTETTHIILDGQKYLLEVGDTVAVVEDINKKARQQLAEKFGRVGNIDEYWDKVDEVKKFLTQRIRLARRESKNQPDLAAKMNLQIKDVYDFIDNYLEDFVTSLADTKTQELINQDKIARSDLSPNQQNMRDIAASVDATRSEHNTQMKDAFGETPRQAIERMKKEGAEERIFESLLSLSIIA
jgi:hypothetical protein